MAIEQLYLCPVCGLHYENKQIAKQCESFCKENNGCSLEITKHSVERKKKGATDLTIMTQQRRLGLVLGLNLAMIAGLIIVGLASHSLGVLAAGGDFAADSTGLLLGIIAIQIAKHPHGYPKATTYVAFINALVLLTVTVFVIVEGIHRLTTHTPHIEGLPVLIVSVVATLFMAIGALILGKDSNKEDLHMRSVLLDTISDGVAAAAVALSGGIIYITGQFHWLDSSVGVLIGLVIGFGAIKLLRDVVIALRAKTPINVT